MLGNVGLKVCGYFEVACNAPLGVITHSMAILESQLQNVVVLFV
jgi:hypothetical protein